MESCTQHEDSLTNFKHEVFLSFNGNSYIANDFVDYIYIALNKKGFKVYNDNNGKVHDERTRMKNYEAIDQSRLSIIVISTCYVQSPWCLDELVKILESMDSNRHRVLPVFYNHMEVVDVANQTGRCCEEAFAAHEKKFSGDKVKKWKSALMEVSRLAVKGLSFRETNWYSAPLRDNIIKEVWKIIGKRHVNVSLEIYGSEATAERMRKWMEDVVKIWNQSQVKSSVNE